MDNKKSESAVMKIEDKFKKELSEMDIDNDKKTFLKNSKISSYDKSTVLRYFSNLESLERKFGKVLINFTDSEYYETFSVSTNNRSVKAMNKISNKYIDYYCIKHDINVEEVKIRDISVNDICHILGGNRKDKRYMTNDTYKKIVNNVNAFSLDPIYDRTLIELLYRGLSVSDIIHLTISNVDVNNSILTYGEEKYKINISEQLKEDILNTYNLKTIHKKNDSEKDLLISDNIFRSDVEYATDLSKIQSFVMRVKRKIANILPDDLRKSCTSFNFRYSGKFNYINRRAQDYGLSFIDDITIDEPISNEKINIYRKIYSEYLGVENFDSRIFYDLKTTYIELATSIKNGIIY